MSKELIVQSAKEAGVTSGRILAQSIGAEAMYSQSIYDRAKNKIPNWQWPGLLLSVSLLQGLLPCTYQVHLGSNRLEQNMDYTEPLTPIQRKKFEAVAYGANIIDFGSFFSRFMLIPNPEGLVVSQIAYNAMVNTVFETASVGKVLGKWIKKA